jgi:hypothetical protein
MSSVGAIESNFLYGLSYDEIKERIREEIRTGALPNSWKDFYEGSTGTAIVELLAAFAVLINYEVSKAREESYLTTANLESSILHAAATLGYPVNRESALELRLKIATNPLSGVTNEPFDELKSQYEIYVFPRLPNFADIRSSIQYNSPYFAFHESLPLSISPLSPEGGYRDYLLMVPRPSPSVDRPDLQNLSNWTEVVLHAGTWKRMVVKGKEILDKGGRLVIRDSVDNNNIVIRHYDGNEVNPTPRLVKTTKYFEETLPISPGSDKKNLPVFELTMPYGVVLLFGQYFGFPISANDILVIDYLSPYPYTGSVDIGKISIAHPGYQVKPDTGDFYPPGGSGDTLKVVSSYSLSDSKEKVRYTAFGYRASQRRAVTLNDYKYLMLSWRGDIVDAKAMIGGGPGMCCQVDVSYASIFFNEAGVPFPRILSPEEKLEAMAYLSKFAVAGTTVRIVDPNYIEFEYRATITVEPRALGDVQREVSEYFNNISPKFDLNITVGKITTDLSRISGVVAIYPESTDPAGLGPLDVLVPRGRIQYRLATN